MSDATGAYEGLTQFLYRAPIGLLQIDLSGAIEMINPMSAQLLIPLTQGNGLDNLFTALSTVAPQVREMVVSFTQPTGIICESVRLQIDAHLRRPAQVLSLSILKLNEHSLMVVIMDVTLEVQREQEALSRELKEAAQVDTLTQLPNRSVVLERIQQILEHPHEAGCEFAVFLINCDRFKQLNDGLGRAVGDQVLGMIAERLRSVLRSEDRSGRTPARGSLAARNGGDEFVVVLDDLSHPDDVHVIAQRLLDTLNRPYGVGTRQIHNGVSIGIVLREHTEGNADAVLQKASIALAEAKHTRVGGRYVVFEPAMQDRAAQRGGIEADLRVALAEGQLFVMYQPVVGLQGLAGPDSCAGVEALVRWRHPTRGLVAPLDFIAVAEECGLIGAVGDFVLSTACRQFVEWQQRLGALAPRMLAVNLSRAQLFQPDLIARVGAILQSSAMYAGQLQLEVTESLAAQDETVRERLYELKALHLTLALDDFGTGYSSLASLHQLPVDTIKIDRSFVSQAHNSQHHRVLIDATVKVANSLGMSTVAEGIETDAQADVVRQLGVDKGQGYFYSRPLLSVDLISWLHAQQPAAATPAMLGTSTPAHSRMASR